MRSTVFGKQSIVGSPKLQNFWCQSHTNLTCGLNLTNLLAKKTIPGFQHRNTRIIMNSLGKSFNKLRSGYKQLSTPKLMDPFTYLFLSFLACAIW